MATVDGGAFHFGGIKRRMGGLSIVAAVVLLVAWFGLPGARLPGLTSITTSQLVGLALGDPATLQGFGFWNFLGLAAVVLPWVAPWLRKRWAPLLNIAPLLVLLVAVGSLLLQFHHAQSQVSGLIDALSGQQAAAVNAANGLFLPMQQAGISLAWGLWVVLVASSVLAAAGIQRCATDACATARPAHRHAAQVLVGYLLVTNIAVAVLVVRMASSNGWAPYTWFFVGLGISMAIQLTATIKPSRGVFVCLVGLAVASIVASVARSPNMLLGNTVHLHLDGTYLSTISAIHSLLEPGGGLRLINDVKPFQLYSMFQLRVVTWLMLAEPLVIYLIGMVLLHVGSSHLPGSEAFTVSPDQVRSPAAVPVAAPAPPNASASAAYCRKCGTPLVAGDAFCGECGAQR